MATTTTLQPTAASPQVFLSNSPTPATQDLPIPRGPVTSTLSFYQPPADSSAPFNYVETPPAGQPQRNFGENPQPVQLSDLRGRESAFTLDSNAFAALSHVPSAATDWSSDAHIKAVYYPEVERLLLDNLPGAHKVVLFDHTIRRNTPNATRGPVTRVHIDQTPASAAARVKLHLGADEADELLKGRYRIVNVWRPLNGPVVAHPLAVADSATVRDEDLVGVQHRYPDRNGETAGVAYNPGQAWYYWSGMRNDERLLLKCSDSDETVGRWGRVPHTAFVDPRTPEGAVGRESIEVRALVFG
ncbi:putative 7alpha-cephem-methoxylase P8 chain related protein [Mytilinidion resinicola]|uniref:7alpha-cephem-methoxylase P8 chain related protein n=1 Tax=Mytilinidion resinicola TaxID=574789 RepID=A0A6A6Y8K6_9PEZI|nr:putative 7alpha-cephem-methoxylase P8 chain related protein [Mytilinidion resinicola]KAF2805030.1 putative 7alpha-cephem-methoxylase P8 chain related protein [Mytilinidion resinicola]